VNSKELAVLFWNKYVSAIRAFEFEVLGDFFTGAKGLITDFTFILTVTTIVVVEIMMGSVAMRASCIFRARLTIVTLDWFLLLAILPFIVGL
jgi:hypothetical protein